MFELIFGVVWTTFSSFFIYGFYFLADEVEVNGEIVSQTEFSQMLFPKIFMGLFLLIGIFMIIDGLRKIIKAISIHTNGVEKIATIKNIPSPTLFINDVPYCNAVVLIEDEMGNEVEVVSNNTFRQGEFNIGDCVVAKYYNGMVSLVGPAEGYETLNTIQSEINYNYQNDQFYHNNQQNDYVTINGKKHDMKNEFEFE